MEGTDWVKRDNEYIWDDRVVDQKTAEEHQGTGASYVGKEVQMAVKGSDGELKEHVGLHADGSISKDGKTFGVGLNGSFENSNGSVFRPKQTRGSFAGVSYNFAALGGFGFSLGYVSDATGKDSPYFTFNGNIGVGAGAGLDYERFLLMEVINFI